MNDDFDEAFIRSIQLNDVATITRLVDTRPEEVRKVFYGGGPAVVWAVKLGRPQILKVLLKICPPHVQDVCGQAPMHHAAAQGHVEMVRVLLVSLLLGSRSLHEPTIHGRTPLEYAIAGGHHEVVELLLPHCGLDCVEGCSALQLAQAENEPRVLAVINEYLEAQRCKASLESMVSSGEHSTAASRASRL